MTEIPHPLYLAENHGDRIALIDDDNTFTWQDIARTSSLLAKQLASSGLNPNDKIAWIAGNARQTVTLLPALWSVRAVAVLLPSRYPPAELSRLAGETDCRAQVCFDDRATRLSGLTQINVNFEPADKRTSQDSMAPTLPSDQPATVVFTSGSTGRPKAALHRLGNHYYNALGSNEVIPLEPGDRWLQSLPLYHVGGLGVYWRSLLAGSSIVCPGDDWVEAVIRHRVTHLSVVPTQLRRLLDDPRCGEASHSLKTILLGGGPIPTGLVSEARDAGLPILPTYGLTEMTSQVATAPPESPDSLRTLPYRELKPADDGEILVRGETLFAGYVEGEKINRPIDGDGWFHTGDVGIRRDDGSLAVSGRKDSMFVSGGENIHPETIETALMQIDGIENAVVCPVDDPDFGQRPAAFIRLQPDYYLSRADSDIDEDDRFRLDHDSLNQTLEQTLPRFMLPVVYYVWPHSYEPSGLKADRAFFLDLVARLRKSRH